MTAIAISRPTDGSRRRKSFTRFTQAEVKRAVQGVCRAGFEPRDVTIFPDGRISIQLVDDTPTQTNSWDEVLK